MKLSSVFTTLALLASGAVAASLAPCSAKSPLPCRCPKGTDYAESITTMIVGANAKDVGALINNFFDCAWLGAVPWQTRGKENTVGAVRTSLFPTPIGNYNISEKLIEYQVHRDGSFIQRFEQLKSTVPVPYHSGDGFFGGHWVTLEAKAIFKHSTLIAFHNYACETGHVSDFAGFHEWALSNAADILSADGKVPGVSAGPFSAQDF